LHLDSARRARAVNPCASLRGAALRALTALRASHRGGYARGRGQRSRCRGRGGVRDHHEKGLRTAGRGRRSRRV